MNEDYQNCKKFERWIPLYLSDKLSQDETLELIEHVKNCPNCKEELTIQHMVAVGLNDLDQIISINVDEELEAEKKSILASLRKKDRAERTFLGILFINVSAFFMALMMLIL